ELVEGLDLALQLDAVDEVDRDRDALFAPGVEKRLLQSLSFRHFYSFIDFLNCDSCLSIQRKCSTRGVHFVVSTSGRGWQIQDSACRVRFRGIDPGPSRFAAQPGD